MKNTFKEITELYSRKQKEYKSEENPFRNFEKAGELRGISREEALDFFRLKHEVSILEMIDDGKKYREKIITEKFNDYIIYTIILNEMVKYSSPRVNFIEKFINGSYFNKPILDESIYTLKIHSSHCRELNFELVHYDYLVSAMIVLKNYMLEHKSYE